MAAKQIYTTLPCPGKEKKRSLNSTLNTLKTVFKRALTALSAFGYMTGACLLDSEDIIIPVIMISVSLLWLVPFAIRSGKDFTYEDGQE